MTTKKELLATAKELDIKGRHDMTKEELEQAVAEAQKPKNATSEAPRDEFGRVIRRGRNLSGNQPWKYKYYFLDLDVYEATKEAREKAPNQVKLLLRCMAENDVTDPGNAMIGRDIASMAKEQGLKTSIPSANLFAYYRKTMETLGLVHAQDI